MANATHSHGKCTRTWTYRPIQGHATVLEVGRHRVPRWLAAKVGDALARAPSHAVSLTCAHASAVRPRHRTAHASCYVRTPCAVECIAGECIAGVGCAARRGGGWEATATYDLSSRSCGSGRRSTHPAIPCQGRHSARCHCQNRHLRPSLTHQAHHRTRGTWPWWRWAAIRGNPRLFCKLHKSTWQVCAEPAGNARRTSRRRQQLGTASTGSACAGM